MKITDDQKARINRVFVNGLIVMIAGAFTALFQYVSQIDFGAWSPVVMSVSAAGLKAVQSWAEPVQDIYR